MKDIKLQEHVNQVKESDSSCVACGRYVPYGFWVCKMCEKQNGVIFHNDISEDIELYMSAAINK